MEIKLPKWATTIKDEGVLTFVAFADRMCRLNGFDTTYTLHIDDLVRMCNKRANGLLDWIRSFPECDANMELGQLYDTVICFKLPEPVIERHPYAGRPKKEYTFPKEITSSRQQHIWMYLLGCLNHNIIIGEDPTRPEDRNSFGLKEFHITREAIEYIHKKPR